MALRRVLLVILTLGATWRLVPARELSFEDRVEAQEAIERVHYSHQLGTSSPFETAVPREALEQEVRTYLQQSAALDVFWKTPVTGLMLRREMERQARSSRMPERLVELHAALGNDPTLVQECLARAVLVRRLTANAFAFDPAIHASARREAGAMRERLAAGLLDPSADHPARREVELLVHQPGADPGRRELPDDPARRPAAGGRRVDLDRREFQIHRAALPARVGEPSQVLEEREDFQIRVVLEDRTEGSRVAIYTVPKRTWDDWWEEVAPSLDEHTVGVTADDGVPLPIPSARGDAWAQSAVATASGSAARSGAAAWPCLPDGTWDSSATDAHPLPRFGHTAVWTGSEMIVWGGRIQYALSATGGRYDPATDTWSSVSAHGAPSGRTDHSAVWTGSEMIIWGGTDSWRTNTGGRYNPTTDSWAPVATAGAPAGRAGHTAVWTGSRMIVWGGEGAATVEYTGGRYNPMTDTWARMTNAGVPMARAGHTAIWTGTRMIIWGGHGAGSIGALRTGGRYDPARNAWHGLSPVGAPGAREGHSAVWTGRSMVVWGGRDGSSELLTGGRYNPSTNRWKSLSTTGAPSARSGHSSAWDGSRVLIWGGSSTDAGGRYDPAADAWSPLSQAGAPSPRSYQTTVWTGDRMIVWGGISPAGEYLDSGGRYDPATDRWTPTATTDAPDARFEHTAIWTGHEMIVWGGARWAGGDLATGGLYNPATDAWRPTSLAAPPTARGRHTAVWAGTAMLIYGGGGRNSNGSFSYDPLHDRWIRIGSGDPRTSHTAVWTGQMMIVWGGWGDGSPLASGRMYDPATKQWVSTPLHVGLASARYGHSAVWTGDRMIVWGGSDGTSWLSGGARFDPVYQGWTPVSDVGAPSERFHHTAVWTGSRMLVWGGETNVPLGDGGLYDPAADAWSQVSSAGAPSPRSGHTALWTGSRMLVWGGADGQGLTDDGGLYDPAADEWSSISLAGAPAPRRGHTAVWTGGSMLLWGGEGIDGPIRSGATYSLGMQTDEDRDGYSECGGDCNDASPAAFPGGVELCDGVDNDCDGSVDNLPPPADVPDLRVALAAPDVAWLTWTSAPSATAYDVVAGDLWELHITNGNFASATIGCFWDERTELFMGAGGMPFPDGGYWYLVRPTNCQGAGSYDSGSPGQVRSRDPGIEAAAWHCP